MIDTMYESIFDLEQNAFEDPKFLEKEDKNLGENYSSTR